ncbi:MAG TPA: cytochrome c biogenesis protein CcdA [Coriobacteriia bacterium]|nr:cytochrome c biogenesis protein CcdA [Coriobacteriia bacterium]
MADNIGFLAAFGAGMLSFLSPCVLPIIPGYLSFMTGLTIAELSKRERPLSEVLIPSLLFVAGFSIVFVSFGATASVIGQSLADYREAMEKIGGLALVAFGILMLGIIRVPWLYGEARLDLAKTKRFGRGAALVMGMAFAAGWTPCVGPILASILALAGASSSAGTGALLLLAYSLGLGAPFILVGVLFGRMTPLLGWISRHSLVLNRVAGGILIALGVLVFSGRMSVLGGWLTRTFPFFTI